MGASAIAVHGKPPWVDLLVYATVVVTVLSAVDYFFNFHTLIRRREAAHARRSSHSRVET